MNEILVLAEHRDGELADITFEMLGKAAALAGAGGGQRPGLGGLPQ